MGTRHSRDSEKSPAREEAEGVELFEQLPDSSVLQRTREDAQGVEVFDDPDAVVAATSVRDGAPGQEALAAEPDSFDPDGQEGLQGPQD